jgi:hypothetical protein
MPNYSPELIQTMRAALDEVMATIPANQATPEVKAYLAEIILKAAARGQTHHEGLFAAASEEIQRVLSQLALLRPSRPQTVAHGAKAVMRKSARNDAGPTQVRSVTRDGAKIDARAAETKARVEALPRGADRLGQREHSARKVRSREQAGGAGTPG